MTLGQAVLAARPLPGPGVVQLISESSNPHVRYAALLGAAVGDCGLVIALKAEFLMCSQAQIGELCVLEMVKFSHPHQVSIGILGIGGEICMLLNW